MLQAELRTSLCNETVGESYAMFALSSSPSHLFLAEAAGDTNIFKDSVVWVTLSAQHGQNFESLEPYDDSGHMEENLFNRASMYGELHITKSCSSDGRRVSLESKLGKFFFANEDEEEDSDSETQILEVVLGKGWRDRVREPLKSYNLLWMIKLRVGSIWELYTSKS
jgi:hypothetical protein